MESRFTSPTSLRFCKHSYFQTVKSLASAPRVPCASRPPRAGAAANEVRRSERTGVGSTSPRFCSWCSGAAAPAPTASRASLPPAPRRARRSLNVLFPGRRGLWCVNRINSLAPSRADQPAACGGSSASIPESRTVARERGDGAAPGLAAVFGARWHAERAWGLQPRERLFANQGAGRRRRGFLAAAAPPPPPPCPSPRVLSAHRAPASRPHPAQSSACGAAALPAPSYGGPARPRATVHRAAHSA